MRKYWYLFLPFVLLALVRYNIPVISGETYLIHNTIADSILDGNKWGLHALVKLMDIPLLPTLALALTKIVVNPLGMNPVALLCACSQAAALMILAGAVPKTHKFSLYAVVAVVLLPAVPLFKNFILVNDPNWISAVPLALALGALARYSKDRQLKDLITLAINLSILVFCGPILLCVAAVILVVLSFNIDDASPKGSLCILWMPFIYMLILWFPWFATGKDNFLVMFSDALSRAKANAFVPSVDPRAFFAGGIAAFILSIKTERNMTARCLLPVVIVIPALTYVANGTRIATPALGPAIILAIAFLAVNAFHNASLQFKTPQIAAALALVLFLVMAIRHPHISFQTRTMPELVMKEASRTTEPPIDLFDSRDATDREVIVKLADEQWKGSRIVLPSARLFAAVYPDPFQKHFVPMPTFKEEDFRKLASSEQFHLLVPPPDGRFYDPESPLAIIHAKGAPYLFLVAKLENNWQLWRAMPPPKPKP